MKSTMQDLPLTITSLLRRGGSMFPESEVITFEGESSRHTKFPDVAARVPRLAAAL
jgi:fatty-acyl-CoA synthase